MKSRLALLLTLTMVLGQIRMLGQSDTWTDPTTKLMWAGQDNGSDVDWNSAVNYCKTLRLGGHANWRLATIDELEGIYDPTQDVNGYHIKGGIRVSGVVWSSSDRLFGEAWGFNFKDGQRTSNPTDFDFRSRAVCVRRS